MSDIDEEPDFENREPTCKIIEIKQDKQLHTQAFSDLMFQLSLLKLLMGRDMFLKLRSLTGFDILPTVSSDVVLQGEIRPLLGTLYQISNHLLALAVRLNEIRSQVFINSSKFNISRPLKIKLDNCDDITSCSIKINGLCDTDAVRNADIIKSNESWCLMERKLVEILEDLSERSANTTFQERASVFEMKKMNKIRRIKLIYNVIWGIMSLHNIDYKSNEEFRDILYRVNEAQNLSLHGKNTR